MVEQNVHFHKTYCCQTNKSKSKIAVFFISFIKGTCWSYFFINKIYLHSILRGCQAPSALFVFFIYHIRNITIVSSHSKHQYCDLSFNIRVNWAISNSKLRKLSVFVPQLVIRIFKYFFVTRVFLNYNILHNLKSP